MRAEVCFAARMPASRAAWSGSPFFTAPRRMRRSASRDIVIIPRATASRFVTGLAPTSTIFTRPRTSTWDSRPGPPALRVFAIALREKERQTFERHGQIHALQLHIRRHLERPGRKIQDGL